jgi:hypothetical protein
MQGDGGRPPERRAGLGTGQTKRRILVGTWAAAEWAIRFYQRNGFELVSQERKTVLLETYWSIPERQIETSVVLADPPYVDA